MTPAEQWEALASVTTLPPRHQWRRWLHPDGMEALVVAGDLLRVASARARSAEVQLVDNQGQVQAVRSLRPPRTGAPLPTPPLDLVLACPLGRAWLRGERWAGPPWTGEVRLYVVPSIWLAHAVDRLSPHYDGCHMVLGLWGVPDQLTTLAAIIGRLPAGTVVELNAPYPPPGQAVPQVAAMLDRWPRCVRDHETYPDTWVLA